MQFLKTLFWVVLTVILVLFANANWTAVTLRLWGGLEADVKLPVLLLFVFLLGFLPTFILYRARLWSMKRRLEPGERGTTPAAPGGAVTPVNVTNHPENRIATDSKAWPTA